MAVEASLEGSEARTTDQAPKHREPVLRLEHHIASSSEGLWGLSCWGEMKIAGDKPHLFFFFPLRGNVQVLCLWLLTLGHSKGRVGWTRVTQGESGVGGTTERLGGVAVGFSGPGYTWISQQPSFFKKTPNPSEGKSNYLTL